MDTQLCALLASKDPAFSPNKYHSTERLFVLMRFIHFKKCMTFKLNSFILTYVRFSGLEKKKNQQSLFKSVLLRCAAVI